MTTGQVLRIMEQRLRATERGPTTSEQCLRTTKQCLRTTQQCLTTTEQCLRTTEQCSWRFLRFPKQIIAFSRIGDDCEKSSVPDLREFVWFGLKVEFDCLKDIVKCFLFGFTLRPAAFERRNIGDKVA